MAARPSGRNLEVRPSMNRTRSSSSPGATRRSEPAHLNPGPARPSHVRSQSYITPTDPKPTNAATFPAPTTANDKPAETSRLHRLHLTGRHHDKSSNNAEAKQAPRAQGKHRYTQSEAQQYHKKAEPGGANDSPLTPTITARPATPPDYGNDLLYPSSRGAPIPSLMRITSARSHRVQAALDSRYYGESSSDVRSALRRQATSDPRSPAYDGNSSYNNNNNNNDSANSNQVRPPRKSQIELELERADYLRQTAYETATDADIKNTKQQLKRATQALQARLTNTTRTSSELMHRLDDAEDSLFRTAESLFDTISSFSNLSDQSSKLVTNFEHETRNLDHETRQSIRQFRKSISGNRAKRVDEMEKRGVAMAQKAEELGRRLENCRTIVKNWEEREINKRKAWRGVWVGVLWGVALVSIAILAGVASWKVIGIGWGRGTVEERLIQKQQQHQHHQHFNNNTNFDTEADLMSLNVPEDVRRVLLDIDARVQKSHADNNGGAGGGAGGDDDNHKNKNKKPGVREDRRFRLLDEL